MNGLKFKFMPAGIKSLHEVLAEYVVLKEQETFRSRFLANNTLARSLQATLDRHAGLRATTPADLGGRDGPSFTPGFGPSDVYGLESMLPPSGLTNLRLPEDLWGAGDGSRLAFPDGLGDGGGQTLLHAILSESSRDALSTIQNRVPAHSVDQEMIAQSSSWPLFTPEGARGPVENRLDHYQDIMEECVGY
ncbi:hypothetical protein QBZ16_002952 [Prototheca wickerhamii]|uniref:Uncharacterized protein n=1 Tax=Prototheca wickerhamii TaxID=3111 RepID=A0AAD9MNQ3_PROWI|nr:hypothetical protein QBZ16_002952 [Prototheca wickerhamii]